MTRPLTPTEQLLTDLLASAAVQSRQQALILAELRRVRIGIGILASTDLEQEEPSHAD